MIRKYRERQTHLKGIRRKANRDLNMNPFPKNIPQEKKDLIINSDITQLKKLLFRSEITSVDIVSVYGERCYTYGR